MSPRALAFFFVLAACSDSAPAPTPFTPYDPPRPTAPVLDRAYAQELNHPFSADDSFAPYVAVLDPPASYASFDRPTGVTSRGWLSHAGATTFHSIPGLDADLIDAAVGGGRVFLATTSTVFELAPDGSARAVVAPTAIRGLAPGREGVHVYLSEGYGLARPGAEVTWMRGPLITALHETSGATFVGAMDSVTAYESGPGSAQLWTLEALGVGTVRAIVSDVTLPRALDLVVIGDDGVVGVGLAGGPRKVEVPEFARGRVPLDSPRDAERTSDGGFVVATAKGAMRILDRGDGPEWRVYVAERWLPSEDVRGVFTRAEPDSPIWFATAGGLAHVTVERMTLEQKMSHFVDRIVTRHDRDGAVADSHLTTKGDLSTNIPWDSDNDGSWTSYWLMSECFRWKVTQAADAKANFDKSLEAMLRLRDVTGTDYFLARAVIRKAGCQLDDCDDPDDGKWYTSPDGEWWVKRDTSNDEVIAHTVMMGHAYDLCADAPQKDRIAKHIGGIIGGIIDHGFQLIDPVTNLVTTYGQFEPAYINDSLPGMIGDGGQRSAMILSELTLAYYLTGEARFADAKKLLIEQHHYADNAVREAEYAVRPGVGDGDEMSTYAWFVLLRYEPDLALRVRWQEGWSRTHVALAKQQGAWWDIVNAQVSGADPKVDRVLGWLQRAPMDMVRWSIRNSLRLDLAPAPEPYDQAGRMRSDGKIIPYDERRCDRWNTDQFKVDGGFGGVVEMDGADVLAPYWMARYYGFITPAE